MTEEERQRVLRESLETLQRLEGLEVGRSSHEDALRQPVEDKLERWRREHQELADQRANANAERKSRERLERRLMQEIAGLRSELRAEIADRHQAMIEIVGQAIGEHSNDLVGEVQAAFDKLRAVISKPGDASDVVDLPNPLRPLRSVN